jgi:acyl carrier protein
LNHVFVTRQYLPVDVTLASTAVIDTLALVLSVDPSTIEETALLAELDADSLAVVEVVFGLEERFGIQLPDDAVRGVRTVSDLVALVSL